MFAFFAIFLGWSNASAQTDAEYAAANAEIQANGVYKIYTLSNGSSIGETKYYLKTDGYLTEDASAAGVFTFDLQRIFGGFKMAGYRINQFTNGGDSNNNFSGDALKKIVTSGQNRKDWEAQVFFKGENGYAVRSTNATSTSWGASAFWTVVEDNDNDNLPNATYTVNEVPYVWQLEKVTDGDFSDVTAKYITNYNPVSNADGWVATNGNRLNQWASNPITFDSDNNCAEMWNNQGATLKQTLNSLAEGFYELTAIALARDGQVTTLSAGTSSTPIATVGSGTVNDRSGANTWFNNGNGVTTLAFTVDGTSSVEIGLKTGNEGDAWTVWRAFYLTYNSEPIALRKALAAAKETANTALGNESYTTVTGYERTQLSTSIAKTIDESGKTPSELTTAYNALIEEINEKLAAFTQAPKYYEQLTEENSRAALFDLPAQSAEEQPAITALDTQAKAIYNHVTTNYNTIIDLGTWTTENAGDMSGQHWDGTSTTSYNEQLEGWSGTTQWTTSYSQTITLPAGDYVFKVAGRRAEYATLVLNVKKGEDVLGTVNDFPNDGNTGRGIATDGTASFADGATYANNGAGRGWQWRYVPFTITDESAEVTISIEGGNPEGKQYQYVSFCNYTVQSAPSVAASRVAYNQAKEAAIAALDNSEYQNVAGEERDALVNAINANPTETIEWYDNQTDILKEVTAAFIAAKAGWDIYANNYPAEKAKADAISEDIDDDIATPQNATEAAEAVNNLKVAEYNYVVNNYTTAIELGDWNQEGGTTFNYGGQHWSGENKGYWEQTPANYSASSWTISFNQTIELPAGQYIFKVAGRHASGDVTMSLDVTSGESTLGTVNDFPAGDTGKGIDTSGATNFSADGTYANNNNGRGWEWRFVPFELTETTTVKIAVNAKATALYKWISFCDYTVQAIPNIEASKVVLQQTIDAADAVVPTTNIGTSAFQYDQQVVTTLQDAIQAAKDAKNDENATIASIEAANSALIAAVEAFNNAELNAPADGQLFNVILTYNGWTYDNKAMTYLAGDRTDMGNYNIKYTAEANTNLAQAFTFTKVEGNNYKMSQIDADGITRYVCTGVPYNGNTSQIRTTTNAGDALAVTVIPTTKEGVWNLYNTEASNYIGSQDAGVFTVNSHIDFKLVETTKPSITINTTAAGWGTTILPFAAVIPSGVKVYSVSEMNGTELTLEEVTAVEANKPYIIEGAWNQTLTGDAQGTTLTYTEGLLTGVYAQQAAPVGSYVMQKLNEKVAFYLVTEGKQPNMPANRAYVTVPANDAKMLTIGGDATGISTIDALLNGDAEIYNVSGMKQNSLQKGMNIIKMNDGTTRKVMVK